MTQLIASIKSPFNIIVTNSKLANFKFSKETKIFKNFEVMHTIAQVLVRLKIESVND